MYAIVEILGQQFKVEEGKSIFVHRLPNEPGDSVTFDKVYLIENGDDIRVGKPVIEGCSVKAKVEEHVRGQKVLVFKKKRRKSYQKMTGHRQDFTKISIESIVAA